MVWSCGVVVRTDGERQKGEMVTENEVRELIS